MHDRLACVYSSNVGTRDAVLNVDDGALGSVSERCGTADGERHRSSLVSKAGHADDERHRAPDERRGKGLRVKFDDRGFERIAAYAARRHADRMTPERHVAAQFAKHAAVRNRARDDAVALPIEFELRVFGRDAARSDAHETFSGRAVVGRRAGNDRRPSARSVWDYFRVRNRPVARHDGSRRAAVGMARGVEAFAQQESRDESSADLFGQREMQLVIGVGVALVIRRRPIVGHDPDDHVRRPALFRVDVRRDDLRPRTGDGRNVRLLVGRLVSGARMRFDRLEAWIVVERR